MNEQILVRYGDLMLKGRNKRTFVKEMRENVKRKVNNPHVEYIDMHDRMFVVLNGEDANEILRDLQLVSGLHSFSLVSVTENNLDDIIALAKRLIADEIKVDVTFKIETIRALKSFPMTSTEVSQSIAGEILRSSELLHVDVHNPEVVLFVEIRQEGALVYLNKIKAMGGFPYGLAGKGLLMLSGGIDSPVAGYLSMKQGVELECIHFESSPLTSIESAQKAIDLGKELAKYTKFDSIKVHMVPFMKIHQDLLENVKESYMITIMRRMMVRISEQVALRQRALAIITGESIGQVASQTLESMHTINDVTSFPIIRPLATYDKQEIIEISKEINCYEISIRPFSDCCTVYVPKSPAIHPRAYIASRYEKYIDMTLIKETVDQVMTFEVSRDTSLDLSQLGFTVKEAYEELNKEELSKEELSKEELTKEKLSKEE